MVSRYFPPNFEQVKKLEVTKLYTIHCFAVRYDFIAYCSGSGVYVYHEPTNKVSPRATTLSWNDISS